MIRWMYGVVVACARSAVDTVLVVGWLFLAIAANAWVSHLDSFGIAALAVVNLVLVAVAFGGAFVVSRVRGELSSGDGKNAGAAAEVGESMPEER